jgi:hypothetical protein
MGFRMIYHMPHKIKNFNFGTKVPKSRDRYNFSASCPNFEIDSSFDASRNSTSKNKKSAQFRSYTKKLWPKNRKKVPKFSVFEKFKERSSWCQFKSFLLLCAQDIKECLCKISANSNGCQKS